MRRFVSVVLVWAAASGNAGIRAAERDAKDEAFGKPQVRLAITIVEASEQERHEIERTLGFTSKRVVLFQALDEKLVESLKERKLLRVLTAPTITTQSGVRASVSYEAGQGPDRQGRVKPVTRELEVSPRVEQGKAIATEIRYRETTGDGDHRRTSEIDTGGRVKVGELCVVSCLPLGPNEAKNGNYKLILLKASIEDSKLPAQALLPMPREGLLQSAAPAKAR